MGEAAWQQACVKAGRPRVRLHTALYICSWIDAIPQKPLIVSLQNRHCHACAVQVGIELTEAVTPLEAGLYGAVSLAKGCYIGQETLAKVHMKGIAKQLIGVRLSAPAAPGDTVTEGMRTKAHRCLQPLP